MHTVTFKEIKGCTVAVGATSKRFPVWVNHKGNCAIWIAEDRACYLHMNGGVGLRSWSRLVIPANYVRVDNDLFVRIMHVSEASKLRLGV
jgi:hypothetical protein